MFGPPGHAYLYLIYGMYWCFNVVARPDGIAAAVLIRAAVPLENCEGHLSGPGALCRGMHLDGRRYGADLGSDSLHLLSREGPAPRVVTGPRVNVDYAGEWAMKPWRFAIDQEPAVSRPRPFKIVRSQGGQPVLPLRRRRPGT
jgi:DNA-3-methyladenine glycosylase